jgi:hypothetical protein
MEEEWAIQKLLTTYSVSASRGDWDAAVGTYLPDGVWAIPHFAMRLEGHAAILGALTGFFGEMDYVVQMNGPALITVTGDTATARCNIREAGKSRGKPEGFEFFGQYADRVVRTPDGWRFEERVFEHLGTHYFAVTQQ